MARLMRCEICGAAFICEGFGLRGSCWCASVKTDKEGLKKISSLASDCVCRDCLEKYQRLG